MKSIVVTCMLIVAITGMTVVVLAEEGYSTPSGEVRIVGGDADPKGVAVGDKVFPLDDYRAELVNRVGKLVLVGIYSGGTACPAQFAWLDTTPGRVRLSKKFGTCSDLADVSSDAETVTVTMPSFDSSEGNIAFIYNGDGIERRVLGLASSQIAKQAGERVDAWIGESPYEYLTAREYEAALIAAIGWDDLDALRSTVVIGEQKMVKDGNWVVGTGCKPQRCVTILQPLPFIARLESSSRRSSKTDVCRGSSGNLMMPCRLVYGRS